MATVKIYAVQSKSRRIVDDYLTDAYLDAMAERTMRETLGQTDVKIVTHEVDVGENGDHLYRRFVEQRRLRQ